MEAVLHLWLGQRPVSEQAKKLVPLKKKKVYSSGMTNILEIKKKDKYKKVPVNAWGYNHWILC